MATTFTTFRTVEPTGRPESRTGNDQDIRSRQIDELISISEDARRDVYGPNSDTDAKNFYNLRDRDRKMPTFRPRISAPQLQLLLLSEAADATDANIRVFIHKGDGRDKQREKAFQQHWRQEFFNLQTLMSQVYAQFSGTSFLQVGCDPFAKQGKGSVWLRARRQETVHCDPNSWWPADWNWQILADKMQLDEIRKTYGKAADAIHPKGQRTPPIAGPPAGNLEMPPGPMSQTVRGLPTSGSYDTSGPFTVRTALVRDVGIREPSPEEVLAIEAKKLPVPEYISMYPFGRMIVDCEGTVLSDGHAWLPLGDMWPAMPVWAVPPWDTVWCPAPMKYTKSLQDAAEQQMTNTYENSRRLNNGIMVIHESTGLTANTVGGLPGEILMVAANSPPGQGVQILYPNPMPPQMVQLPQAYLNLQKEMRGATPARQGQTTGNVGPDLFEAAISQASSGTRLTARLFAWTMQKVAELLFYTMSKSFTEPVIFRDKDDSIKWEPNQDATDDYQVQLPEGAIRPMSASLLRTMVIELRKAGMIDVKHALDWLDVPDSEEIAEAIENEQKLAALAKLNRK